MKTISQILIVVLIVGGIIGGIVYFLMSRGKSITDRPDPQSLFNEMQAYVDGYSDSIEDGWSDEYLTTINVYVAGYKQYLAPAQLSTINDKVQVTFLEALDKLIRSYYGSQMTSGSYADNPKLLKAYKGLDATAAQYPDIKSLPAWSKLKALKSAHEEIYNFGKRTHNVAPRLKPQVGWSLNAPARINHGDLFDYYSYADRQENTRMNLSAKCNTFPELSSSPWTAEALSKSKLASAISSARSAYRDAEQRSIDRFASSMMPDIHKHVADHGTFTKAEGAAYLNALDAFISTLSAEGYSTSSLKSARDSFDRVYVQ